MNSLQENLQIAYSTIYNLMGTHDLIIFPIGKTKKLLRKDVIMIGEKDRSFLPKIGIEVDNPDSALLNLFDKFVQYKYDAIIVANGIVVKFNVGYKKFAVHIFFTVDKNLLEWIYFYGYKSSYTPEKKELIMNLIAETLPPRIEEWHNKSLGIIERYSVLKFSKEYGIYNISKTFKGRHGYAKKAYETNIKTVKYTDPIDCINYFLDLDEVYTSNPNSITTEVIIEGVKNSERMTKYIKNNILKRFFI